MGNLENNVYVENKKKNYIAPHVEVHFLRLETCIAATSTVSPTNLQGQIFEEIDEEEMSHEIIW